MSHRTWVTFQKYVILSPGSVQFHGIWTVQTPKNDARVTPIMWPHESPAASSEMCWSDELFLLFHSPLKFSGGDSWLRGPLPSGNPSTVCPGSGEHPMEVSGVEQMDTSSSCTSEVSAPLPIRPPSGIQAGPFKKQAYPMNSKRPEHLRMNLWPLACYSSLSIAVPVFYSFPFQRL